MSKPPEDSLEWFYKAASELGAWIFSGCVILSLGMCGHGACTSGNVKMSTEKTP
jgi:hypothetical protein